MELSILNDARISHNKVCCLEHLPRKDFPCSENSRAQKTSIQNSNKLDLEIWIASGGYQK
jgi:hypothetical protein